VLKNNWRLRLRIWRQVREVRVASLVITWRRHSRSLSLFAVAESGWAERVARRKGGERWLVIHRRAAEQQPARDSCLPATRSKRGSQCWCVLGARRVCWQISSDRDASVRSVHVQKLAPQNQRTPRPLPPLPRRGKCPREMGGRVRTTELVQHHHRQVHFSLFCFVWFRRQHVRAALPLPATRARAQSSHMFVAKFLLFGVENYREYLCFLILRLF